MPDKKLERKSRIHNTYGVDIAKEFNDIKASISTLSEKIHNQTTEFEKQLTKLNTNMEKVLSQIADHEARITDLEKKQIKDDEHSKVIEQVKEFGTKALYAGFWLVVIVGAANGVKPLLKVFTLFLS